MAAAARGRFRVVWKEEDLGRVRLIPVVGGSKENDLLYAKTPAGAIELQSLAPTALAGFCIGDVFLVDFRPA